MRGRSHRFRAGHPWIFASDVVSAPPVEAGAVPWDFARQSEEAHPVARLKLMARVFDTLEIVGRTALLTLARSTKPSAR